MELSIQRIQLLHRSSSPFFLESIPAPGTEYKIFRNFHVAHRQKETNKGVWNRVIKVINQRIERRRQESKASSNFQGLTHVSFRIYRERGWWLRKQAACLWLQGLRVESTLRYSDNYLSSRVFRTQCHRSRLVHGEAAPGSVE